MLMVLTISVVAGASVGFAVSVGLGAYVGFVVSVTVGVSVGLIASVGFSLVLPPQPVAITANIKKRRDRFIFEFVRVIFLPPMIYALNYELIPDVKVKLEIEPEVYSPPTQMRYAPV